MTGMDAADAAGAADPATPAARASTGRAVAVAARPAAPASPGLSGVARGAAVNLGGAAVMAAATFGATMAVTRGLSRADAGVFFSATSLFLLAVSVGQLGTDAGLVYFLSRSRTLDTVPNCRRLYRIAIRPVVLTAVVMSVALFVLAPTIARWSSPDHPALAATSLRILAVCIPFANIEAVTLSATRGMGSMRANALVEQLGRAPVQLLLVLVVLVAPTAHRFALAWALPYVPAAGIALLFWRRVSARAEGRQNAAPAVWGLNGRFWRFAAPRALTTVTQAAMQRFDIVLVGALSGAINAAIYAAATRFVVAGQMANNAVALATQPRLAETLSVDDRAGANVVYQHATAWLLLVTGPIYVVLLIYGPTLMGVFGRGYRTGAVVLVLIPLAMLVSAVCGMVDGVLAMAGRTSWNLLNIAVAFGTNLGLDLWLIPHHGVVGAAIGWACAIVIKNLLALSQVGLVMHLHPFGRGLECATFLLLFGFGAIAALPRLLFGSSVAALIIGTALASAVYVLGAYRLRQPLHLDAALHALRRSRRRRLGQGQA